MSAATPVRIAVGDALLEGALDVPAHAVGLVLFVLAAAVGCMWVKNPEHLLLQHAPSVLFVAVTLEESGLLGSQYYVAHPAIPLDKTVAVVNLDEGATSDLTGSVDVGAQVVEQLENNDQLGWQFMSEAAAHDAVASGAVYAAIVIPADFSISVCCRPASVNSNVSPLASNAISRSISSRFHISAIRT